MVEDRRLLSTVARSAAPHHLEHLFDRKPHSFVVMDAAILRKALLAARGVGKHHKRHADRFEHLAELVG